MKEAFVFARPCGILDTPAGETTLLGFALFRAIDFFYQAAEQRTRKGRLYGRRVCEARMISTIVARPVAWRGFQNTTSTRPVPHASN